MHARGDTLQCVDVVGHADARGAADRARVAGGADPDRAAAQDLLEEPRAEESDDLSRRDVHRVGDRAGAGAAPALDAVAHPVAVGKRLDLVPVGSPEVRLPPGPHGRRRGSHGRSLATAAAGPRHRASRTKAPGRGWRGGTGSPGDAPGCATDSSLSDRGRRSGLFDADRRPQGSGERSNNPSAADCGRSPPAVSRERADANASEKSAWPGTSLPRPRPRALEHH